MPKPIKFAIAIAVLIVLIFVVPFPHRVNFAQPGFRVYSDLSEEPIKMIIKGWHWRSFTGYSKLNGTMEVTDTGGGGSYTGDFRGNAPFFLGGFYQTSVWLSPRSYPYNLLLCGNKRLNTFIALHTYGYNEENRYLDMASADSGKSSGDILEFFRQYAPFDWEG